MSAKQEHGTTEGSYPQSLADRPDRAPQAVYPIFLTNLANWSIVVVGGGKVAARKVKGLLATGAHVTVIAPALAPPLADLQATGQIDWYARAYMPTDVAHAQLVFAATNDRAVNAAVAQAAHAAGALCNVVDDPEVGNFHLPAVHRSPEAIWAVGTGGTSPRRAVALRDWLVEWLTSRRPSS